jgi:hypothetical protein
MKLYIIYKDDGPSGVCGQDMYTTSHRNKLYILEGTYQQIKDKIDEMVSFFSKRNFGRKNPRFCDYYTDDMNDSYNDVVYMSVEE